MLRSKLDHEIEIHNPQWSTGAVAAPETLWVDEKAEYLPEPGLVCRFVYRVTKPSIPWMRCANLEVIGR